VKEINPLVKIGAYLTPEDDPDLIVLITSIEGGEFVGITVQQGYSKVAVGSEIRRYAKYSGWKEVSKYYTPLWKLLND
jgi:hypothetical protein